MGSTNLDGHWDLLAGRVREDFAGIFEGNTFALPDAAIWVRALEVLESSLDISVSVGRLLVEDLITASGLETLAGHTGSRAGDGAVSSNRRGEASNGNCGGVRLHVCLLIVGLEGREVVNEGKEGLASCKECENE